MYLSAIGLIRAKDAGGMNTPETTYQYSKDIEKNKGAHEDLFIRAAQEVLDIQIRAGISIPTDGEVRRRKLYPLPLPAPRWF